MKKMYFITFILMVLFTGNLLFSENITLLKINNLPRNIAPNDAVLINNTLMENLLDLNSLMNNSYVSSTTLEKWVNTKIEMINATNTNTRVIGKRTVRPKKLRPINLNRLAPTVLKAVNSYVTINGILLVNFISKVKKDKTGTINITFTLYNSLGLKIATSVATVPLNMIQDNLYMSQKIKEAVITAYNMWPRYYYALKDTGAVNFSFSPRSAKVYIKMIDKILGSGKNDGIPFGSYTVLVSASNYVTLLTNLTLSSKTMNFKAVLKKFNPASLQPGAPPSGNLYLDADYPNAKFTIIEDGISGRVPMLLTNLRANEKTVVFDETPDYALKNMKVTVRENDTVYESAKLAKKGSGFKLVCNVDGASVVLDREIVGTVANGSFSMNVPAGLHVITVMKDKFEAVRTNITMTSESKEEISVTMNPKKVPGIVITPQSDKIPVYVSDVQAGTTPASLNLDRSDNYRFVLAGTNMGFYNTETNLGWDWKSDNNLLVILKPLYGDARIATTPDNVSVAVDNYYRGKSGSNGVLVLYQLPSKIIKLRAEKDGFRTFTTNVYIFPNIENSFSVSLKEAPAKAFVTTSPEKEFEVFVNGDYVGISGEGVISLEFGSVTIKARKRGFKTVSTNIVASNRNPIVINFATSPGMGEEEFVEQVSAVYREGMILVDNYDLDGAVKKFTEAKGLIDGSGLEDLPSVMELTEKINFQLKRYSMLSQVNELEDTGDLYMDKENYDDAIKNYQDAVALLDKSEIIKINQNVKERRKAIFQKYKKAERLKIKPVKWWPMMTRNWSGFGFDIIVSDISRYGPTVTLQKLNLPAYFKARWNFLPIMGIQIGGMYNFWYMNPKLYAIEKYLPYAFMFGANLRLPLLPSWSFFGEYNFTVADFSTFNVIENATIDIGIDLKFGWFGVKLMYEMGFTSNFNYIHHGFGGGFTVWLTEE